MMIRRSLASMTFVLAFGTQAHAIERSDVSSKVLYRAVDQLTEYLERDLGKMAQQTKKTAIVNYTQSEELPESIQHYLVKRLEYVANRNQSTPVKFVRCMECLSIQAVAEGDEIFIRKGVTDEKQLAETMTKLGIRKYADVNLAYTGDQLVMQMSVVNKDRMVDWSGEYKTPYQAYHDSQWLLNVGLEAATFQGEPELPSTKGVRVYMGQRLVGFGAAGLTASVHESLPGLPQATSFGGFVDLSHNELFNQYWDFARLYYQTGVGVSDFNGTQFLNQTVGVKAVMAGHYSVALNARAHQFLSKPKESAPIDNPDGKPLLNNDDNLPMMVSLTFGVELL